MGQAVRVGSRLTEKNTRWVDYFNPLIRLGPHRITRSPREPSAGRGGLARITRITLKCIIFFLHPYIFI